MDIKMAVLTEHWFWGVSLLLLAICAGFYIHAKKRFRYWKNKNVKSTEPETLFGDTNGLGAVTGFSRSVTKALWDIYKGYSGEKIVGMYMFLNPQLLVKDLELIKTIFIKDFSSFHSHHTCKGDLEIKEEPLDGHLGNLTGKKWHNLRIRLNQAFTSGKMKKMFPTAVEVSLKLNKLLEEESSLQDLDMSQEFKKYILDVVSIFGFGLESSCVENPNAKIWQIASRVTTDARPTFVRLLAGTAPKLKALFKIRIFPKEVTEYFIGVVKDVTEYRRLNNVEKKDFMQCLIRLIDQGYIDDEDSIADDEKEQFQFDETTAAAQAFVFLMGATTTIASVMNFAMYELGKRPDLRERLQKEIDSVTAKHGGKLTYEGVQEMLYLDMVVSEVLRLYPNQPKTSRLCNEDYTIPGTNTQIEKGAVLWILILGIHRDPKIYPDPEKFDPERFSPEAKSQRHPCSYMPFGAGPRLCLGERFALMLIKVGLAVFLTKFNVLAGEKTPKVLELDLTRGSLLPKNPIFLKFEKRQ